MPSRPISSLANGFLTLLGVKNMGKNPDTLLDEVRATVEMTPWYLEANAVNLSVATPTQVAVLTGLAGFSDLTVPQGELWYVHGVTGRVYVPAVPTVVDIVDMQAAALTPNPGFCYAGEPLTVQLATPGIEGYSIQCKSLRNIWVPAGTVIGIWFGRVDVQVAAGIAYGLEAQCRVTRLRV